MKVVKLKPVVLNFNEAFIKPPKFLDCEEFSQEKWKGAILVEIEGLKEFLMQKKIVKDSVVKKDRVDSEEEAVRNLSQWKRSMSPVSPLLRKYTFKKQITSMGIVSESKEKLRGSSHAVTIEPRKNVKSNTFINQVYSIVASERFKKKKNEEQFFRISQNNMNAENEINNNIERINSELDEFKQSIKYLNEIILKIKDKIRSSEKEHEDMQRQLKNYETTEYLSMTKVKDGGMEEGRGMIFKEKIRKSRRDLHKKYLEEMEELKYSLSNAERKLEQCDFDRQKCKKQLRDYKEDISNLYYRILKEGKDLRSEGLRWVIKALWKNGGSVPISTFPKYLDEENIIYLVKVSEKDLEIEYLNKKVEKMRKEAKSHRTNTSVSSSRELYQSVKSRLRDISRSVICSPIENLSQNPEHTLNENSSSCYSEIGTIRETINKISDWIKEYTHDEIKRTTENYKISPGEADKVGLYHLIKCLVGDKVREFNKYTRNQQAKVKGLFEIKSKS